MASYYNPSRRLSDWAAAALSPFIQLETQDGQSSQSSCLSVALWSGQVQLKNVELRPEAFDQYLNPSQPEFNEFGTSIRWKIIHGTIDDVSVSIPWKRLLVGTSYSSSRKRGRQNKHGVAVVEGQNEVNRSLLRLDSDAGPSTVEMGSCVDQEGEQAPNQPAEDNKNTLGCTIIKIDGVDLIIGYEVIHQSLDPSQSQSFNADNCAVEEQSQKRVRDEKNRILQIAERRLLAGLDPFPPDLTESLEKDIQSILQSSLEQSMSEHLSLNHPSNKTPENTSTSTTYISDFFSATIKSLLWRAYDSLSVSVSRVRMSVVGDSHYDKKVRILSKKRRIRKRSQQKLDEKPDKLKRPIRSSFHAQKTSFDSAFKERHQRFISADFWDHNWEQYPATITPVRRGGTSKLRHSGSTLEECSNEDSSGDCSKDEDKPEAAADAEEEDATVWSKEGHVELGLVLDKLDIRPGLVSQNLSLKQRIDGNEETCEVKDQGPMSVKHMHFRSIGVFVRRAPLSSLITKRKSEPKQQRKGPKEKRFWHGLEHDEFIIIPTSIETDCKFYRHASGGDTATISSMPTANDKSADNYSKQRPSKPGISHDRSDRSHATTDTKRRDKRDKIRLKSVEQSTKSTMQTIESNFTESCLIPKQLELNWKVGHVRCPVSSRHMYLVCSALQSLIRLKRGRPSVTIRSAKTYDRELIKRMAEEGKPVIAALDAHMYRILPQLRLSRKYSHQKLLTLQDVVLAWWKYAITSVILELNQRNNLIDKCKSSSERKQSNNPTTVQKLQWDWNNQSRIRREHIELYLLVNEIRPVDEIDQKQSTTNRAALLAAESRLEELENGLSVERIMLLRKISRAALLSANATHAEAPASSFYNFSTISGQAENVSRVVDDFDQRADKVEFAVETDVQTCKHDDADNRPGPKKFTTLEEKANVNVNDTVGDPLLCCSSVAFAGFSLALSELYYKEKVDKEDLSDDISALTGFSGSVDTSSLYQLSEQYTIHEKFDPTHNFWEHDKRKLHHEPIILLHISDITASLQHSNLKRKCKVLIGGVCICNGTHPTSAIVSVGHMSGLEIPSEESSPKTTYMSTLTVWDGTSPTRTYSSIKSLSVNVDWKFFQQITTFWTLNRESDRKNHLAPLHKESSLRNIIFEKKPTTQMSLSLECESIRVRIPISAVDTEELASVAVLSLVALRLGIGGAPENVERAPANSRGHKVVIDKFNVQVIHQSSSMSFDENTTQDFFQIPLTIKVHSADLASNQPIVIGISPVQLFISEDRIKTIMPLVQQCLRLCSSDKVESLRPELPAISEYAVAEVQLSIESIGLHLRTKGNEKEVPKCSSSQHYLREITTNYLYLISCLDIEYPNQDVINCIARLYEDQCVALGLSQEDAQKCFVTALSSYQEDIRSLYVESCTSSDTEQAIAIAAEKALSALGGTPNLPEAGLFIHTDAVSISWSAFYCKSMLQIKARSLECHDGTGTKLVEIAKADVPLSPNEDSFALTASLSSNEVTTSNVRREVYFELDGALVTFRPESYSNALAVFQNLADVYSIDPNKADKPSMNVNGPTFSAPNLMVNGTLSSISFLITDDNIPFARFFSSGLSLSHTSAPGEYPHTSLLAEEVMLQCVSPASAELYSNVVTTHLIDTEDCCTERSALVIRITNERGIRSDIVDISICFDGVRVTFLRQFVNELIQYISSSKYGLGLMQKSKEHHQTKTDKIDHPHSSLRMAINLTRSTIILPRDSNSIDLVGIELDELSICPLFVKDSWTLDSYSFHECTKSPPKMNSSEVFFDCVEDQMALSVSSGPQISRIDMHLRGARLYTALNALQHSSNNVNLSFWNSFVRCSGRCATNKPVYTQRMSLNDDTANVQISSEIKSRTWQEVTFEPLNIVVKVDSTPHLRLMIEMMGKSLLGMRMSQLYLLMSIWYSNMQQLPVLFPYDEKFVEETSIPPSTPPNWPEYGSDEFIKILKESIPDGTFELALCIEKLVLKCSYDPPGYFAKDPSTQLMIGTDAISLSLECAICSVVSGDVLRVGVGATDMELLDGRPTTPYEQKANIKNVNGVLPSVNVNWGLDCGCHTLIDGLDLPFQVTVFMTPDNHCMINLGGDSLNGTLQDLSIIWILLDFFGLYFKDPAYGHPCFISDQIVQQVLGCGDIEYGSLDIDFRLWLTNPHLIIPSSAEKHGLCIMLEATSGIHYRYKSYGVSYSSQDVVAKDLAIVALREYMESSVSRRRRQVSGCLKSTGAQTLIDGLSFSVQYDYNESANYNKLAVCIPLSAEHFDRTNMNGMETKSIGAQPLLCQPPLICKPFFLPSRDMKTMFTTYLTMEYMKVASEVLIAFVGRNVEDNPESHTPAQRNNIYCVTAHVNGAAFILSDPVMGMHRPHLSISLPSLIISVSQLEAPEKNFSRRKSLDSLEAHSNCVYDLQASIETTMFVDYFKLGKTRNWEPLIEPFKCLVLYEKSQERGQGVTINMDCPLHLNITSAAIDTFDDAKNTFESFCSSTADITYPRQSVSDLDTIIESPPSHGICLIHSRAEVIDEGERRAFALTNNTGQQIRVHTLSSLDKSVACCKTTRTRVFYLDHEQTMPLTFPATTTVIRNLKPIEVMVEDHNDQVQNRLSNHHHHLIDIQVPRFQWLHGVSIEDAGRKFIDLIPRSLAVQSKVDADWRLRNGLQLLAHVQSLHGGRRLSLRSPFEVVNKTDHSILLSLNPDPRYTPQSNGNAENAFEKHGFESEEVHPDDSFTVPHLLLEKALQMHGSHLGSLWIKPKPANNILQPDFLGDSTTIDNNCVEYPKLPIQLAKIVHETAVIWRESKADPMVANQFASGTEISCPILDSLNNPQTAPYCYVVEVKRSPLASQKFEENVDMAQRELFSPIERLKSSRYKPIKDADEAFQHQPVHYSLVIHPPIVIENLLPERGRFELMHATSRIVLWWGIIEPGQKVPVHTVGLDVPILLLVNLGFCRTPVGEGALVHHGRKSGGLFKAGWNSLGHAMRSSKDKVKKTLFTVTESIDHRGAGRVSAVQRGMKSPNDANSRKIGSLGFSNENNIDENAIRYGESFDTDAIDSETIVIDSIGQRLTLHLDNVIGGGGQRFISLFCPYWIVNTTNHSLRYKQDKVAGYTSGTVLSPDLDGSKRVDGSNRADEEKYKYDLRRLDHSQEPYSTIFSGRPGALHKQDGQIEPVVLASLLSENLPLSIMSSLAFMFNFEDVLSLGSPPRLCVQLADVANKSYTSAWSSGFGLESVGVTQIVGMHCKDGRRLEVSISVTIAPGRLSNYTKIVRICPRYVIVNQMSQSIRLWQDNSMLHPNQPIEHSSKVNESERWILSNLSNTETRFNEYQALFGEQIVVDVDYSFPDTSAHHDACYIGTIKPSALIAFHLPDTRIDRMLRIDFGSAWNLSSSILADVTGSHYLTITRSVDLRLLPHVSTRAAPVYTVTIPSPDKPWTGELGAYFETDWGREKTLIVKGVKDGSYAFYWTDITVGDELISIDGIAVEEFTFDEAIKFMKARFSSTKDKTDSMHQFFRKTKNQTDETLEQSDRIELTFMTLEERMRNLRRKAVIGRAKTNLRNSITKKSHFSKNEKPENNMNQTKNLLIDMKFLFQSIFIFVQEPKAKDAPHIIRNRSLQWAIYYRQRNCEGHPWLMLYPGESAPYTWQEPTKPKKLSVRVGNCEGASTNKKEQRGSKVPFFSLHFINNEEEGYYGATKTIKMEEIGHIDVLPCPENRHKEQTEKVYCTVDTEGLTRALIISDEMKGSYKDDETLIKCHLANIRQEIASEDRKRTQLGVFDSILSDAENTSTSNNGSHHYLSSRQQISLVESELRELIDYAEGQYIDRRHQVLVQVLEATGLVSANINGLSNPYAKVSLRHRTSAFKSATQSRSTYFIEKSLSPMWSEQIFVFDVPEKAADDPRETRNLSLQCIIKSREKLGKDSFLGQVQIQLRDLIDQQESIGWYPLMNMLGQRDVDSVDRIRGSVKIRLHYVMDYRGLISYYKLCSEQRIDALKKTKSGMQRQLRALRETAQQQAGVKESVSFDSVPALTMIVKRKGAGYNKQKSRLTEVKDHEKLNQSSRIIQGVRDGTENLKKSIGLAKSVVQRKRRNSYRSSIGSAVDKDWSRSVILDSPLVEDETVSDEHASVNVNSVNLLVQESSSSNDEDGVIKAHSSIGPQPMNFISKNGVYSSRVASLRGRCIDSQAAYSSWITRRAYMRAVYSAGHLHNKKKHESNKSGLSDILQLPLSAPSFVKDRERKYTEALMKSRLLFSKKAKRSLSSVVNPGGVLTIRPITALNLADDYNGMFLKLRYGTTILISETVDCKVAPVWTEDENNLSTYNHSSTPKKKQRKSMLIKRKASDAGPSELADLTEIINPLARWGRPQKNDLQIEVAPFETSKSLRLSVIGERMSQSNVEIGILDIELGSAIECCTQSLEEFEEELAREINEVSPPAYVRWFPLTYPTDALPIEGDMGQSAKPKESEKPRDDMFREYFAPCIKLALMFKPYSDDIEDNQKSSDERSEKSRENELSTSNQYFYAKLDCLSAALIDSNRTSIGELLSFTSRCADFRLSVTKAKTRVSFAVGHVQIDQQRMTQDSRAPVILAPSPCKHPQPLIQFLVWKDNVQSKPELDSFEYVAIEVQNLDLKMDESLLFDLWEFYVAITKSRERKNLCRNIQQTPPQFSSCGKEETEDIQAFACDFLNNGPGAIATSKKVYIRELIIGFMKISLSYYKRKNSLEDDLNTARYELFLSPKVLSQRTSDRNTSDEAFKQWSENNTYFADESDDSPSPATINIVSAIIPSISDASISFQGKLIEHVFERRADVWKSLRSHYSSEALKQIYKIVGSLDFVGNPSMLLTSFRTGLRDFILQPSRELKHITRNPSRLGVGVLKGTVSLFSNSTSGIFGFFSNIGLTASRTSTKFTFDEHFQRHHSQKETAQHRHYDRWKRKGCGHVTLIVTRPVHDIVFSVISATTGVMTEPYRGAKSNGVVGFSKGVGVGILGLVVKPVVGLCDAFAHVMGSFDDIAKSVNLIDVKFKPIERYRLPYTFSASKMLMPFNEVPSKSAQLLLAYPLDKKSKRIEEVIVTSQALHIGPGWDHFVVVTTKRVVFFKLKDIDGTGFITISLDWQVRFEPETRISSSLVTKGHNRLALYITKSTSINDINQEEISLSNNEDTNNFSRMESKEDHDSSYVNLDRMHSLPETPKSFRLRNSRLFTSTEAEGVQRFLIEGDFSQRRHLVQLHNAICCLSGNLDELISEGRYFTGNEGITIFGNLSFGESEITTQIEDLKLLFSALERSPWQWTSGADGEAISNEYNSFPSEQELMLDIESSVTNEHIDHFTFDGSSFDGSQKIYTTKAPPGFEPPPDESVSIPSVDDETASPAFTVYKENPSSNRETNDQGETKSPLHIPHAERKPGAHSLDLRLKRVEELLEHLVHNQSPNTSLDAVESTQPVEQQGQDHTGQHFNDKLSPIKELSEKDNNSSNDTADIKTLKNEISELKRANMQLQEQVKAGQKTKVGIVKMFNLR